jgi:hypothetical protein
VELDSGALDSYTDFTVTFRYVNYSNDVSR